MEQILVIDQGTHASRCMIFTADGQLLAQSRHPVSIYRQGEKFIEQNAEEILASIYYCIDQLQHQLDFSQVSTAALVTQRSTIVGWHKQSGKMLSPAISWQDTRGADTLLTLSPYSAEIKNISGLPLSAHYGASKMQWLIENDENCREAYEDQNLVVAPLASYLVEQLTGITEAVIDHVNAQRTQLLDIDQLDWSEQLLKLFKLQPHCLPKTLPCLSDYGLFRHHPIQLKLVTGDQNAAVFAQPADKQTLLVNVGSGAFVLKLTDQRSNKPLMLDGIAVSTEDAVQYLKEGTVNGAGSALALLFNEIDEDQLFQQLPDWLQSVSAPAIFINSISGLGSPWWNNSIVPHYLNAEADELSLAERAVAIIESIVFLLQCNIEKLADAETQQINISGGLARLDGLCQKLADLSQTVVKRGNNKEASATGAAWLLGDQANWHQADATEVFLPAQNIGLQNRYRLFNQHLVSITEQSDNNRVKKAARR